jgi:hypothetical protein
MGLSFGCRFHGESDIAVDSDEGTNADEIYQVLFANNRLGAALLNVGLIECLLQAYLMGYRMFGRRHFLQNRKGWSQLYGTIVDWGNRMGYSTFLPLYIS